MPFLRGFRSLLGACAKFLLSPGDFHQARQPRLAIGYVDRLTVLAFHHDGDAFRDARSSVRLTPHSVSPQLGARGLPSALGPRKSKSPMALLLVQAESMA